ncbi:MAG: FecR domain-containing protein [Ginsengibacter sp.]
MLDEKNVYVKSLFQKYLNNSCTAEEVRMLLQHFNLAENETLLRSLIRQQSDLPEESSPVSDVEDHPLLDDVFNKIKNAIAVDVTTDVRYIVPLYRKTWFRVCAAASLIIAISMSAFYFLHQKNENFVAQKENKTLRSNIITPGTNNAVLTLDNGSTIILDHAANGTLAQQGNSKVLKINGQISYQKESGDMSAKTVYNTITTSNGNEYQLILADGSKVWLNAASSIRFPASFAGNERNVEITGEAYFEVAKDKTKPFHVKVGDMQVNVLGTHFNVNSYSDENSIKTSLLEGSVKITKGSLSGTLKPGQQGIVKNKGDKVDIREADMDEAVAWKNGLFQFSGANITSIMKQIGRWYDVEIVYDDKVPDRSFEGKIRRDAQLSDVLKILELSNVKFTVVGKKIIVH